MCLWHNIPNYIKHTFRRSIKSIFSVNWFQSTLGVKRFGAKLSGTTGNCSPSGIILTQSIKSSKCCSVFSLPNQIDLDAVLSSETLFMLQGPRHDVIFSCTVSPILCSSQADFSKSIGTSLLPFSILPQQHPEQTYSFAGIKSTHRILVN